MGVRRRFRQYRDGIERWLEVEREQLVLWVPVMLGAGIAAWFVLPDAGRWAGFMLAAGAGALIGALTGGRLGRAVLIAGLMAASGCALVWWRAESVAAPVLGRPAVVAFEGRIERVEHLAARELVRLTMRRRIARTCRACFGSMWRTGTCRWAQGAARWWRCGRG